MIIYPIVYPSALQFWFNTNYASEQYLPKDGHFSVLPHDYQLTVFPRTTEILSQMYCLSYPIRLLAANENRRIHQKEIACSIRSKHVPDDCFVQVDILRNDIPIYVACPEYCFLQASSELPLHKLIQLGYQLCARYTPDDRSQYKQRRRLPITSTAKILAFLDRCKGSHGVKKARQAIRYVLDNSNSPMETLFTMAAILPCHMGGFGLKKPELNADVLLSAKAQALLKTDTLCCDLVWRKEKVIVEYDSILVHLEAEQFKYDKKRASALNMSGYKVFHITSDFLDNFTAYQKTFDSIRCALKIKKDSRCLDKYQNERYDLFQFIWLECNLY